MYPLCCSTAEKLLFFHSLKGRKIVPSPSHPDTTDGGETVAGFGWLEMSPYGETLRAGRRPHNAIWSIWLYDGVCQIESSDVAFSRQNSRSVVSEMCPPIASLNSRCVCAECQVICETAAPYWHHCRNKDSRAWDDGGRRLAKDS